MKKFILLLLLTIALFSCGTNVAVLREVDPEIISSTLKKDKIIFKYSNDIPISSKKIWLIAKDQMGKNGFEFR